MFQLEKSLDEWKRRLYDSSSFTKSDLEELESHLLEEIHILMEKNLTEEEAFYIACNRIGTVNLLSSEFSKVNSTTIWIKRIIWLISGYFIISVTQRIISISSLFATYYLSNIVSFNSKILTLFNILISIVLSATVIFLSRYMVMSKSQSWFNYLFVFKRAALGIISILFLTMMNIFGIPILSIYMHNMDLYKAKYISGESIFLFIWYIFLCFLSIILLLKNRKQAIN